jgi:hypothetical protein
MFREDNLLRGGGRGSIGSGSNDCGLLITLGSSKGI